MNINHKDICAIQKHLVHYVIIQNQNESIFWIRLLMDFGETARVKAENIKIKKHIVFVYHNFIQLTRDFNTRMPNCDKTIWSNTQHV